MLGNILMLILAILACKAEGQRAWSSKIQIWMLNNSFGLIIYNYIHKPQAHQRRCLYGLMPPQTKQS